MENALADRVGGIPFAGLMLPIKVSGGPIAQKMLNVATAGKQSRRVNTVAGSLSTY
jgi:hypothetical protein